MRDICLKNISLVISTSGARQKLVGRFISSAELPFRRSRRYQKHRRLSFRTLMMFARFVIKRCRQLRSPDVSIISMEFACGNGFTCKTRWDQILMLLLIASECETKRKLNPLLHFSVRCAMKLWLIKIWKQTFKKPTKLFSQKFCTFSSNYQWDNFYLLVSQSLIIYP